VELVEEEEETPSKPARKKRRSKDRSRGKVGSTGLLENKVVWIALALILVGGVVLTVALLTRNRRAPETAQEPAPAGSNAQPQQPQPPPPKQQPQPQLQPPPPKSAEVTAEEAFRNKLIGRWRLLSGLGVSPEQLTLLTKRGIFVYWDFRADGTGQVGRDSLDPATQAALAKEKEPKPFRIKYRVVGPNTIEIIDLSKTGSDGTWAKSERLNVVIGGTAMTMIDGTGTMGSLVRIGDLPR
jgi:hypothetical protein